MNIVVGYDAIHANVSHLPKGAQVAGYTTGSADIVWTASDWAAHPGAVRICQDYGATDTTADVADVETGAVTNSQAAGWYTRALSSYTQGKRPGQRHPAIYTSAGNLTALVNQLIADGVKSGPGLWVANWNLSESQAVGDVQAAAGPFPIIGIQYASGTFYDFDIFSGPWLDRVSGATEYPHTTDGKTSLGKYAATRNMNTISWLSLQNRLHAPDAENLASSAVPPAGEKWWSVHP